MSVTALGSGYAGEGKPVLKNLKFKQKIVQVSRERQLGHSHGGWHSASKTPDSDILPLAIPRSQGFCILRLSVIQPRDKGEHPKGRGVTGV